MSDLPAPRTVRLDGDDTATPRAHPAFGRESLLVLGEGLLDALPRLLVEHQVGQPRVVVTDENLERCYGSRLPAGVSRIVLPPGEASKSLASFGRLAQAMVEAGLDRSGAVIAFGGGVVGDLAGFAAATFMRGVPWVNVPTSLLAMVDASIGGKTAIDLENGKNLVGAFHPPLLVVTDPRLLETLPAGERESGMAEVVKHAIIGNPQLFEQLEEGTFGSVADLERAIRVKVDIVARDPFERGERAKLNVGHTVGHGFERASGYALSHGRAVAIGLVAEGRIAEEIGLAARGLAARIAAVLGRRGLASDLRTFGPADLRTLGLSDLAPGAVRAAMTADKKRVAGRLKFALPRAIGDVVFGVEVDETVVMRVLEELCSPRGLQARSSGR